MLRKYPKLYIMFPTVHLTKNFSNFWLQSTVCLPHGHRNTTKSERGVRDNSWDLFILSNYSTWHCYEIQIFVFSSKFELGKESCLINASKSSELGRT